MRGKQIAGGLAVTRERYQELLEKLLDSELSPSEAVELTEGLRQHPEWLADLRQHLALWDAWSQQVAPERSAESFIAGWQTRVRAEAGAEQFSKSVLDRIRAPTFRFGVPFWKRWGRAWQIGFAVFALAFISMAALWTEQRISQARVSREHAGFLAQIGTNRTVTIVGEGVCPCCVLHEVLPQNGRPPNPAIRVKKDGATVIVYLEFDEYSQSLHPFFTGGTTVTAKGVMRKDKDRLLLKTHNITVNGKQYP